MEFFFALGEDNGILILRSTRTPALSWGLGQIAAIASVSAAKTSRRPSAPGASERRTAGRQNIESRWTSSACFIRTSSPKPGVRFRSQTATNAADLTEQPLFLPGTRSHPKHQTSIDRRILEACILRKSDKIEIRDVYFRYDKKYLRGGGFAAGLCGKLRIA